MVSTPRRRRPLALPPDERRSIAYDMVQTLDVHETVALWRAAAQRLRAGGLAPDAIDETIGSIDTPSPGDCLAALMLPAALDGCRLVDFAIRPAGPIEDIPGSDAPPTMTGH